MQNSSCLNLSLKVQNSSCWVQNSSCLILSCLEQSNFFLNWNYSDESNYYLNLAWNSYCLNSVWKSCYLNVMACWNSWNLCLSLALNMLRLSCLTVLYWCFLRKFLSTTLKTGLTALYMLKQNVNLDCMYYWSWIELYLCCNWNRMAWYMSAFV